MDNPNAIDTDTAPPAGGGIVESWWVVAALAWLPALVGVAVAWGIVDNLTRCPRSHLRLVENQPRRTMGWAQGPRRWRGPGLTQELKDDAAPFIDAVHEHWRNGRPRMPVDTQGRP